MYDCTWTLIWFPIFFVAVTDFTVTQARSNVITFCQPITQIYHSLFIKNPSGTFNYMAFIEPMHYLAWIAVILLCLSAPPFLYLTTRYNYRVSLIIIWLKNFILSLTIWQTLKPNILRSHILRHHFSLPKVILQVQNGNGVLKRLVPSLKNA